MKNEIDQHRKIFGEIWDREFALLSEQDRNTIINAPDGTTSAQLALRVEELTEKAKAENLQDAIEQAEREAGWDSQP